MGWRIDGASTSAWEGHDGRWRPWCFGSCIGTVLTGFTSRLVDEAGKGLRFFGTLAAACLGL
jgi:hypothetical protein